MVLACAPPVTPTGNNGSGGPDAGSVDAGSGADAGSADAGSGADAGSCDGGRCTRACDLCQQDSDCQSGQTCGLVDGCRFCVRQESGGATCSMDGCIEGNECCSGMMCLQPGQQICGGPGPRQGCHSDADCAPDSYCQADHCGGHRCVGDCPGTACGDGESCANGRCVPTQCPQFACPAWEVCAGPTGDAHGCAPKSCATDGDCPDGFCASGTCHGKPGTCIIPPV